MKEKILKGGCCPAFKMENGEILHFFGDTIELTDSKMKLKSIYTRTGRWNYD